MSRMVLATLTLAALAACGRGDRSDVASADSLNRDLQLAPVDTSAALNDRPSADTATSATPRPRLRLRASKPAPQAEAAQAGSGSDGSGSAAAQPAPAPAGRPRRSPRAPRSL